AQQPVEGLGDREWRKRVDVRTENTGQLQREEGISARPLVDPEQGLAREGPPKPVAQSPMKRSDAQGPHPQPPEALRSEPLLEPRGLRPIVEPTGEQHENVVRREPSQ